MRKTLGFGQQKMVVGDDKKKKSSYLIDNKQSTGIQQGLSILFFE